MIRVKDTNIQITSSGILNCLLEQSNTDDKAFLPGVKLRSSIPSSVEQAADTSFI